MDGQMLLDLAGGQAEATRTIHNIITTLVPVGGRFSASTIRQQVVTADVNPRAVGPAFQALRRVGVIVPSGWTVNTDEAGGNAGKPERAYTYRGELQ